MKQEPTLKINIPCPSCGCQICDAENTDGEKVTLEICRCFDGSGEFDVVVSYPNSSIIAVEKHQCSEADLANCLNSIFKINLETITHKCN